jgi:uncharacterized protein with GYD domain
LIYFRPREGNMKLHSLIVVSALAIGLAVPAMAQQSMHRYIAFFKYSDTGIKAMTENPQDRAAAAAKLYEGFGGKMESIYWYPMGGAYDGLVIAQIPDEVTVEALGLMLRSTGNFSNLQTIPLITAEEFKAAMEKVKSVKSSYTPPTATKQ